MSPVWTSGAEVYQQLGVGDLSWSLGKKREPCVMTPVTGVNEIAQREYMEQEDSWGWHSEDPNIKKMAKELPSGSWGLHVMSYTYGTCKPLKQYVYSGAVWKSLADFITLEVGREEELQIVAFHDLFLFRKSSIFHTLQCIYDTCFSLDSLTLTDVIY